MEAPHLSAFAAVVLCAPVVHAQTTAARNEKPLVDSLRGSAKEAYASALLLYKHGDFVGAEIKYGQAYDLAKDPRLLFNQAVCEKELHHYARMQALLVRYEKEAGASLTAEDRAGTDIALAAIKNLVGSVSVTSNVSGADVAVDGQPVGSTPLPDPLVLDLGHHSLVVKKEGFAPVSKALEIQGGGSTSETFTLIQDRRAPEPAAPPPPVRAEETGRIPPAPAQRSRWLEWTLIGGGAAVAVGGAVFMAVEAGNTSDADSYHDRSAYDSALNGWRVALAGTIVGAVAAAGGVVLLAVSRHPDAGHGSRGGFWLGAGPGALHVGGTW